MGKNVIIGAGASGIAAAIKLIEQGLDVTILEAENYVGGRVNTIPFGMNVVDLGAQWCHGEKNNAVFEYCSKLDLFGTTGDFKSSFFLVRSNKQIISQDITSRLMTIVSNILESSKYDLTDTDESLGSYVTQQFYVSLSKPENSDIDEKLAKQFLEFYKKFECSLEGSDDLFDVSGKGLLEYWECEGDPVLNWKGKGYFSFLQLLMGSKSPTDYGILNEKIMLNKKVEQILWSEAIDDKIIIKCTDGDEIKADHVISTFSLGVLKESHKNLFLPNLPAKKINAIEGLAFGTVNKIYLEFPKKFWADNWPGFCILWESNDLEKIEERSDNWIKDIFGFYTVDYQDNVLCGWIVGKNSRQMELHSDNDVLESCLFVLNKFLSWDVPRPVNFKRTTWHKNPNFRGSYSFRSLDSEKLNVYAADLAKPILNSSGKPILQFAGEATHDHYYSTVHGAVESGWREAERLIQYCCNDNVFDVLILGSGLAGLGAAYALRNNDKLKIGILEAQNYVGGRVLTTPMKSLTGEISKSDFIDAGAQWLHGEYNELYKIAKKHNLIAKEVSEEGLGSYFEENGNTVDDLFVKKVDFIIGQILEECEHFTNDKIYPKSVEHFLLEKFRIFVDSLDNKKEREYALKLLNWHIRFQIIDNCSLNLNTVSAKAWGLYSYNGESCQAHINVKDGFSRVINAVVDEIGGYDKIYLKTEVAEINWKCLENEFISVKVVDGKTIYAKNVIVTFSLGVLKNLEETLFQPKLPELYRNTIRDIGFETINKIYLQFDSPWWDKLEGIQFIWDEMDYIYEGNNSKDNHWTKYLTGFDILHPGPTNTLVGWIGGYGAKQIEMLSDDDIIEGCVSIFRKFMKQDVPYPIKYFCSRWGSNPFIRGGYSFISTNCDKNGTDRKILCESIKIGKSCSILFAGEACHENYFSTAHGAFLSGIEQANKLLKF